MDGTTHGIGGPPGDHLGLGDGDHLGTGDQHGVRLLVGVLVRAGVMLPHPADLMLHGVLTATVRYVQIPMLVLLAIVDPQPAAPVLQQAAQEILIPILNGV